ncbi:MAG: hypothetical protein ACREKE_04130 [bacterium]
MPRAPLSLGARCALGWSRFPPTLLSLGAGSTLGWSRLPPTFRRLGMGLTRRLLVFLFMLVLIFVLRAGRNSDCEKYTDNC